MKTRYLWPVLVATLTLFVTARLEAGPKVDIATGPNPPKLVRFAAEEMAGQLKSLFDADVFIADTAPKDAPNVILLGNPDTNPAIRDSLKWPKLSDQGHIVKSVDSGGKKLLVVGGGSPVATLWAAYELGHHFGIRYLLVGDVLPPIRPQFKLDGIDVKLEPVFSVRTWTTLRGESIGLASWGLSDQNKLIAQLAKLKFNRLAAPCAFNAPVFFAGSFPVDGDTPGRKAFRGAKDFVNPEFAKEMSGDERNGVGCALVARIVESARKLGIAFDDASSIPTFEQPANSARPLPEIRLTDSKLGVLPQVHATRIHATLNALRRDRRTGYLVTCEFTGELDPVVHYLSRASFDAAITPEAAYDDLFTTMCGRGDVTGRLALAFQFIEQANDKMEEHRSSIGRTLLGGTDLLDSAKSEAELIKEVSGLYVKATNELQRAHGNCHPDTRRYLFYYTKRGEYAQHYLSCAAAIDAAAESKRKKDQDSLVEQLEKAVESLYNALNSQSDVARDQSDRALIAVLAAKGYRPLMAELEKLTESEK